MDPCDGHLTCKGCRNRIKNAGSMPIFLKGCLQLSMEKIVEKRIKKRKLNAIEKTSLHTFPSFNPSCAVRDCCFLETLEEDNKKKSDEAVVSSTTILTITNGHIPGTYDIPFLGVIDNSTSNSEHLLFNTVSNLGVIESVRNSVVRYSVNQHSAINEEVGRVDVSYTDVSTMDPSMFFYVDVDGIRSKPMLRCLLEAMGGILCDYGTKLEHSTYLFVKHSPIFKDYKFASLFNPDFDYKHYSALCGDIVPCFFGKEGKQIHIANQEFFDSVGKVTCTATPHFDKPAFSAQVVIHKDEVVQALTILTKNGGQLKDVQCMVPLDGEVYTNVFVFYFDYLNFDHVDQLIKDKNLNVFVSPIKNANLINV